MALFVVTVSNYTWSGAESGFVRPEGYTISGAIFKSKNTKLGMKVNMYLEWEKKPQQINKYKKADKYHKHHKIWGKNMIFLLINCLTHFYNTFLLQN